MHLCTRAPVPSLWTPARGQGIVIAVFDHGSRNRLTARDADRFRGGQLFDRLGLAVCQAGCLPRKELYEAWEVARRTRRLFRGGRIVDVGGGHGLLAYTLLLLDDTSPSAVVVDPALPPSAAALREALTERWPRLAGRVVEAHMPFEQFTLRPDDLVVSSHACGALSDQTLARAVEARVRVAVLPCCHDFDTCDRGPLAGWVDGALAIDAMRAVRLQDAGYRVWTQTIPAAITTKNRLLLAQPRQMG